MPHDAAAGRGSQWAAVVAPRKKFLYQAPMSTAAHISSAAASLRPLALGLLLLSCP
jgi:hypothetical protein